ncbi:MAG: hypothetical protein AABY38_05570 [Planctomycetota bacterium]
MNITAINMHSSKRNISKNGEKRIKHGDEYTSTHKGIYSEEGDKDWIALIFHRNCWTRFEKGADKKSVPIFEVEV